MIFGLSAPANSGKDVVANYIVDKYGFTKIAFADKIKRILQDLYQLSDEQLWGESKNRSIFDTRYKTPDGSYLTARLGSQAFGDCGRSLYEKTWVKATIDDVIKLHDHYFWDYKYSKGVYKNIWSPNKKNIIITDCRYINEMNAIKDIGGKVLRIKRLNSGLKDISGKHSSEVNQVQVLDSYFDHILINNSSLVDLYKKIDEFMEKNT